MQRDPRQTNYEYSDFLKIEAANFTSYRNWAGTITQAVAADPISVIDCRPIGPDATCQREAAAEFVRRAFRGAAPTSLTQAYVDAFQDSLNASGSLASAACELVGNVLLSPFFIFRAEIATDAGNALTTLELRQQVAYALTDAPLESVIEAADDADQKALAAEALATPEARGKLLRFFLAWLEIRRPEDFRISTADFPEFSPAVAEQAVAETTAFLEHRLNQPQPKLSELVSSRKAFVGNLLKVIYDGDAGSGGEHDLSKRFGLFNKSAFIASHSGPTEASLVKRGAFFMRKVMCLETGAVPDGVDATIPADIKGSERQRIETATQNAPCIGCHMTINPFGFALNNFDAIGRRRTKDHGVPADSSISLAFLGEPQKETPDPVAALEYFTGSDRFRQCFICQLFRYYLGRQEEPSDDPVMKAMYIQLSNQQEDILGLLQVMAESSRFSQRVQKGENQ